MRFFYFYLFMAIHTLSKTERLKKRTDIALVFAKGKALVVPPVKMLYRLVPQQPGTVQMGVVASKKLFKKAVHRNRVKRLIREAYRTQNGAIKLQAQQLDVGVQVFFIYQSKELPTWAPIQATVQQLLEKLADKIAKHV